MSRFQQFRESLAEIRRQMEKDAVEHQEALQRLRAEMHQDMEDLRLELVRLLERGMLRLDSRLDGLAGTSQDFHRRTDLRFAHLMDNMEHYFYVADQDRDDLRADLSDLKERVRRLEEGRPPAA